MRNLKKILECFRMPANRLFRISSKTKNSTRRRFYMNPSYMNHIDIACIRNIDRIFTWGTIVNYITCKFKRLAFISLVTFINFFDRVFKKILD